MRKIGIAIIICTMSLLSACGNSNKNESKPVPTEQVTTGAETIAESSVEASTSEIEATDESTDESTEATSETSETSETEESIPDYYTNGTSNEMLWNGSSSYYTQYLYENNDEYPLIKDGATGETLVKIKPIFRNVSFHSNGIATGSKYESFAVSTAPAYDKNNATVEEDGSFLNIVVDFADKVDYNNSTDKDIFNQDFHNSIEDGAEPRVSKVEEREVNGHKYSYSQLQYEGKTAGYDAQMLEGIMPYKDAGSIVVIVYNAVASDSKVVDDALMDKIMSSIKF